MKIRIRNNEVGELIIDDYCNNENKKTLPFNTESIFKWYPLNLQYQYQYDSMRDECFLKLIRPQELVLCRYGLQSNSSAQSRKVLTSKGGKLDLYCEPVAEENNLIIERAKLLGVDTPDKPIALWKLSESFSILGKLLDKAFTEAIRPSEGEYKTVSTSYFTIPVEVNDNWYHSLDMATKGHDGDFRGSFKHITREQELEYIQLGEVYTMLGIMRKIERVYKKEKDLLKWQ